jgi:hypothetical protein
MEDIKVVRITEARLSAIDYRPTTHMTLRATVAREKTDDDLLELS